MSQCVRPVASWVCVASAIARLAPAVSIAVIGIAALVGCGGGGGGDGGGGPVPAPTTPASVNNPLVTTGPGDTARFYPFDAGNSWVVEGALTTTAAGTTDSFDTVQVTGTQSVKGFTAQVLHHSLSNVNNFETITLGGAINLGNDQASDIRTQEITPFQDSVFPITAGQSFRQINAQNVNFGLDLDNDGIAEKATVQSQVQVLDFEDVFVTAGTFHNAAKLQTNVSLVVTLSKTKGQMSSNSTDTTWLAPGVGPVKEITQGGQVGGSTTASFAGELRGYSIAGTAWGIGEPAPVFGASNLVFVNGPSALATNGTVSLAVTYDASDPTAWRGMVLDASASPVASVDVWTAPPAPLGNPAQAAAVFDGTNFFVVMSNAGVLYGQHISPSGLLTDARFSLNAGADPVLAFDGTDDNSLLCFDEIGAPGLFCELISNSGQVIVAPFPVDSTFLNTAGTDGELVSVAFDGTNYLVVWQEPSDPPGDPASIVATRISPQTGAIQDPQPIAISTQGATAAVKTLPRVAFDGTNYLICWFDARGQMGTSTVFGNRLTPSGTLMDGPAMDGGFAISHPIASVSSDGLNIGFIGFANGEYLVAWADTQPGAASTPILASRVSKNGVVAGGANGPLVRVSGSPSGLVQAFEPVIAWANGNGVILWHQGNGTGNVVSGSMANALALHPFAN